MLYEVVNITVKEFAIELTELERENLIREVELTIMTAFTKKMEEV